MSATKKQVERQAEQDPQTVVISEPLFETKIATNIKMALAGFQQECPTILQQTKGYGYTYADLPTILNVINPLLKKWGLGFSQPLDGNKVRTIVFHVETGETLESSIDIPQGVMLKGMNDFQVLGSAISYLRRYSISSILGIVSDKDTDASGEQVSKPKKRTLTDSEFVRLCGAINAGTMTAEKAKEDFSLNSSQIETINEL
jgi:hypothetical protein